MVRVLGFLGVLSLMLMSACSKHQQTLNIAVASNFEDTLYKLVDLYEKDRINTNDPEITIISGSSGVLASQIMHNAPYDVFLSADQDKAQYLYQQKSLTTAPQTYAIGQLVLWIPSLQGDHCLSQLQELQTLAIANPETAPYGFVAQQVMQQHHINPAKIIQTANVVQTYLYTKDHLTDAGFVAQSLIHTTDQGCQQTFDNNHLKQDALLLNTKAQAFYDFLLSKKAQSLIKQSGYRIEF